MITVLLLIFAWLLLEYTSLMYRRFQIEQQKQWFVEENDRLVQRNKNLEKQYEYNKTDYFFRKEAKRKLNKKEPGEQIIIISGGSNQSKRSENEWEFRQDFMNRWWEYLFATQLKNPYEND